MLRLFLIRHGQTEWNTNGRYQGQSDIPLTARGIEQAKALAANFEQTYLGGKKLDAIYSSDLQRARRTAELVAEPLGLPVEIDPDFRELSFGDWEGLTHAQIAAGWEEGIKNFFQHPNLLNIPHGETFQQLQDRAVRGIRRIEAKYLAKGEEHYVAVFCHGAVLRAMLAYFLGMPLANVWRVRQFNTAVNIVRLEAEAGAAPGIELMNGTMHLPPELRFDLKDIRDVKGREGHEKK